MKKLKLFLLAAMLFGMIACSNEVNDVPNRDVASERLFRSYISHFAKCEKLDVSYIAGVEINEEKRIFLTNNPKWNSIWSDANINDFFPVTDGIVMFVKGLAKDSSGYFYDVREIGSDDFMTGFHCLL
jgi:hypothetical protein